VDLGLLVRLAAQKQARGVALDFFFPDPASTRAVDDLFCSAVTTARSQDVAVIGGYTYQAFGNTLRRQNPSFTLTCLTPEETGHLIAFLDTDDTVRSLPLYFTGDRELPSMSLTVARRMVAPSSLITPENGIVHFVAPSALPTMIRYEDLKSNPDLAGILQDQWVIVGEESQDDSFLTPFGRLPGAMLHALAIESLVHQRYVKRLAWWHQWLLLFSVCYLLTALAAQGMNARRLVMIAAVASVGVIAVAGAAAWWSLVWIDAVYFLVAVWLLLGLLLGWRRLVAKENEKASAAS
jgi:CHASE2 domain-containing sensor protein